MDQKSTPESRSPRSGTHPSYPAIEQAPRAKYEPPRLVRKHSVQRVTLVSGSECVFDPPGTC